MTRLQKTFGLGVKAHRHRLNLTQQQLADRIGMSMDMIAKIEGGSIGASFATIEKLTEIFGTDAAGLFRINERDARFNPQLADIVGKLAALSETDLIWIEGVIEAALQPRQR